MNLTRSQTSEQLARTGQQPSPEDAYRRTSLTLNTGVNGGNDGASPSAYTNPGLATNGSSSSNQGHCSERNLNCSSNRSRLDEEGQTVAEVDEEGVDMLTFMMQTRGGQQLSERQASASTTSGPVS